MLSSEALLRLNTRIYFRKKLDH